MKSIAQKLRKDALEFKQEPSESLHDYIMQNIEANKASEKRQTLQALKWLVPTGLTAALLLFVFNFQKLNKVELLTYDVHIVESTLPQKNHLVHFAFSLETNVSKELKAEKQAMISDINYLLNLL